MREASDLGIGAGVRRELAGRRVDLSKIKFPVMAGVVTLEGELAFVGLEKTVDETAVELKFMESSIRRIAGVKDIVFALSNWAKSDVGVWESTVAAGGAGFALDGEGITCGGCDYVIRFCPCCGKPLGEAKHGSGAGHKAAKRVMPPIKPVVKRRVPVMTGLGEKPEVAVVDEKLAAAVAPVVPEIPKIPEIPAAPAMPEVAEVAKEPVVPVVPVVSSETEEPVVPIIPVIPSIPEEPKEPVVTPEEPAMAPVMPGAAPAMPGAAPAMPTAAPVMPGAAPVMPAAPLGAAMAPVAPVIPSGTAMAPSDDLDTGVPVIPSIPAMPATPSAPVMPSAPEPAKPAEPAEPEDPFAGFSLSGNMGAAPKPAPKLDTDPFANFNITDFAQGQETTPKPPTLGGAADSKAGHIDFSDLSNDFLKNPFGSDETPQGTVAEEAPGQPAMPDFNLADDLLASISGDAPPTPAEPIAETPAMPVMPSFDEPAPAPVAPSMPAMPSFDEPAPAPVTPSMPAMPSFDEPAPAPVTPSMPTMPPVAEPTPMPPAASPAPQEPLPKGKPSMKIPDFNFDELLSGGGGLEDEGSDDDGLVVFDLEDDDTPLPPMKPTGPAGKIDLNKEANDIFSSLLADPKKDKKASGDKSDGLFGNIDFDADLEIIPTGDDDFGIPSSAPSNNAGPSMDSFDPSNVIDLDAEPPPGPGSKKDPFNLDGFDFSKLNV